MVCDRVAELFGGRESHWLVAGADGVWATFALGGRSILGDPRSEKMQSVMNLKIKYRESFRPFAPSVLRERVSDYFDLETDSPYMLLVAPVAEAVGRVALQANQEKLFGIDLSECTQVGYSGCDSRGLFRSGANRDGLDESSVLSVVTSAFEKQTGCGVLINTSFNVRGEPIVSHSGRCLSMFHAHRNGCVGH